MKIFTYIFIICCFSTYSQNENLLQGKIIDSIIVDNTSKESFAVYLPNQYESSKISPIVFVFDPAARGKTGIKPFIKASEKYGYILICSNNSKNGPYKQNFAIANRLFNKVFDSFKIDEKRIYTAGFSGGSRLAFKIAILSNNIQGVIACGAGLSSKLDLIGQKNKFSYVGIVGDEDMNYLEMNNTRDYLNKMQVSNELFVYDIGHKWPQQNQILRAFNWLQMEAYTKGIIKTNKNTIHNLYIDSYQEASKLKIEGELLYSYQEYQRIIRNFSRYFKLDSIQLKVKEIENNKSFKKEKKKLDSSFDKEIFLVNKFNDRFFNDLDKKIRNINWWKSEINNLHKKNKETESTEGKMLTRLLYKIFAMAIETVNVEGVQNIDQAIFCFDICILIYPKYPLPYLKQIKNYIDKNDETKALNYLEKLLNTGFIDFNSIKENKAFDSLKNNKRYLQLIK